MGTISNFIMSEEGALAPDHCDEIVSRCIDHLNDVNTSVLEPVNTSHGESQFPNGRLGRHDYQLYMPDEVNFTDIYKEASDIVIAMTNEYRQVITTASDYHLYNPRVKFQWTPIGGGFFPWHIEHGGGVNSNRVLAWMIYLNDVEDGGDTEFLYQRVKIKPKKGTFVMWPAGLTHPHRGNPPYSNDKYVLTGWVCCPPDDECQRAFRCSVDDTVGASSAK